MEEKQAPESQFKTVLSRAYFLVLGMSRFVPFYKIRYSYKHTEHRADQEKSIAGYRFCDQKKAVLTKKYQVCLIYKDSQTADPYGCRKRGPHGILQIESALKDHLQKDHGESHNDNKRIIPYPVDEDITSCSQIGICHEQQRHQKNTVQ